MSGFLGRASRSLTVSFCMERMNAPMSVCVYELFSEAGGVAIQEWRRYVAIVMTAELSLKSTLRKAGLNMSSREPSKVRAVYILWVWYYELSIGRDLNGEMGILGLCLL